MAPRLDLHELLTDITPHVYFQPPVNVTLEYPCIIYTREAADTKFADNEPYNHTKRYTITVIDRDPDSVIPDKVAKLRSCIYNRFYTADDLNHDVYQIFF